MNYSHSFLLVFPFLFAIFVWNLMEKKKETVPDEFFTAVNYVIGDKSYIHYYGEKPGTDVPDSVRVRTHLMYVESMLRERSAGYLSDKQKENRLANLDLLRDYYQRGEFPVNDGHSDPRRPAFIDNRGNICAVGFLIEQSEGRHVAEAINARYKYAYIFEIESPAFDEWVENSGFTLDELAMIQPAYDRVIRETVRTNRNEMDLSYGVGSSLMMGANAFYLSNNKDQPRLFTKPESNHWFGLAAGTGAVLLGALNADNRSSYYDYPYGSNCNGHCGVREVIETNHARTAVSFTNMGVGLISMIRSGYHLLAGERNDKSKSEIYPGYVETKMVQESMKVPAVKFKLNF